MNTRNRDGLQIHPWGIGGFKSGNEIFFLKSSKKSNDCEIDPREIGCAFHPDGIRTSKTFHWAGQALRLRKKTISELETI